MGFILVVYRRPTSNIIFKPVAFKSGDFCNNNENVFKSANVFIFLYISSYNFCEKIKT